MSTERVWLITGCSAGFGRRLATSALQRGDKVIATARSLEKLSCLKEKSQGFEDNLRLLELDVTSGLGAIKTKIDEAAGIWGRIDVLVNNAGYGVPAIIEEGGADSIRLQFATNLYGPIDVICAALPHMRAKMSGTIVNIGSRSAWKTEIPGIGPYSASKAALHALTETLSIELAQFNIKTLIVAPGAFKTEGAYNYPWDNPNPLPAYEALRNAALSKFGSIRDAIKGDPDKAMEVVVDVVRGEGVAKDREWPGYLILGEDAEVDIRNKIGKVGKALDDWGDVTRSLVLIMKRVVIIGAGMGGLTFAIKLQKELSVGDFEYTIFEKGSEIGGTWSVNTYPGAASDIGIHFYSLSSDLKPDWTGTHCGHNEILEYWKGLAKKYKLYSHIVFDTRVIGAEWDDTSQSYHVQAESLLTGEKMFTTADILVSAVGVLEQPHHPDIGLSNFKGPLWHSARWRHDVKLEGKRVGVIGNGASASQFVPMISQAPSVHVTQFVRTPNWFLPLARSPFSASWRWAFTQVPFLKSLYRFHDFLVGVYLWMIFASNRFRSYVQGNSKEYILRTAPSVYHSALIPNFPMGCKRIVFDVNYLNSLHRPNVMLSVDGISEVLEDGILTQKGIFKVQTSLILCVDSWYQE
ncbi:hypothetical protein ONZ45_g14771 [Pleurotus djamor]|nr:hypothetical protein ONZ45_g14771 [Pleurotus djamor]